MTFGPFDLRIHMIEKYLTEDWMNKFSQQYKAAQPFPHLVIDDFLPEAALDAVLDEFPTAESEFWYKFDDQFQKKLGSPAEVFMPSSARTLTAELNSGYFLDFLGVLTGIQGLLPDTRLTGGGLHQIKTGGKLGIHVDFNIDPKTRLHRRLNLLLYLNRDWDPAWGGALELRDCRNNMALGREIMPVYNRCVIFGTTETSFHGHPHPLRCPQDVTRKSLALYYYTAHHDDFAPAEKHSTLFAPY